MGSNGRDNALNFEDPNLYTGRQFDDGALEIDLTSLPKKKYTNTEVENKFTQSLAECDKMIERKKQEVLEFNAMIEEQDYENRQLIEDGIETVEGEMKYRIDDVIPKAHKQKLQMDKKNGEFEEDEVEKELKDAIEQEEVLMTPPARRIRMQQRDQEVVKPQPKEEVIQPVEEEEQDYDYEEDIVEEEPELELSEPPVVDQTVEQPKVKEEKQKKPVTEYKENIHATKIMKPNAPVQSIPDAINTSNIDLANMSIDDEDLEDIELEDEDQEEIDRRHEEGFNKLQSEILARLKPIAKSMDTKAIGISKKAVSSASVIARIGASSKPVKTFSWVAPCAARPITVSALTGPELYMLDNFDAGRNSLQMNIQQAQIIYKHDMNPYKPKTLESWAKTINYLDIDHFYAAIYGANYSSANYIPYQCEDDKCGNMQLSDDTPFMKMVKFKDDEAKKKFETIRNKPHTEESSTEFETVIIPISEDIAVGFQSPTLYSVLFENTSLDEDFRKKYLAIATVINYIDMMYFIVNGEYVPIQWKEYPTDISKNFKSKMASYSKIMSTFTDDEHSMFMSYIGSVSTANIDMISYIIPESKCDKCGKTIPESPVYAKDALFTRRQLGTIVTTSID